MMNVHIVKIYFGFIQFILFIEQKLNILMQPVEDKRTRKRYLFKMTEEIDRAIFRNLQKQAIMLVGQSRKGKSTILNWIERVPLQAVNQDKKICYKVQVDQDNSKIGHGIQSCTLVPNIHRGLCFSTVDTAGFGDSVDYIRVLGVSQALQAIFDHAQKVKFILVVEQSQITATNAKNFCESLNYFLNMFNLSDPQARKKIYRSVVLLINMTNSKLQHLNHLTRLRDQLSSSKLKKIENRQYIAQFLQQIVQQNRFCHFDQAVVYRHPESCSIIQQMSVKNWQYFELNNKTRKAYVQLPMSDDFEQLQQAEQEEFVEIINLRIDSYKTVASSIFGMLNDEIAIKSNGGIGNIKQPFAKFYDFLNKFLEENDDYGSAQLIGLNETSGKAYSPLSREKLLLEIIKLKSCFQCVGQDVLSIDTQNAVEQFRAVELSLQQFNDILMNIFARNQEQHRLIYRLNFILFRGIRQFLMLRKVSRESSNNNNNNKIKGIENNAYYMIRQSFQSQNNIQENIRDFIYLFKDNIHERVKLLKKNKKNPVEAYIKSRETAYYIQYLLRKYNKIIEEYLKNANNQQYILRATVKRVLRDVKIIHARYEYELGNYNQAITELIDALRIEVIYEKHQKDLLADEVYDEERDIEQKRQMILNQENILVDILHLLRKVGKFNLGLELALHLKLQYEVCSIYQQLLDKDQNDKKFDKVRAVEYANFCFKINRFQKGVKLYQKVQGAEHDNIKLKKLYKGDLANHILLESEYKNNYIADLQNFQYKYCDEIARRKVVDKIQMIVPKDEIYYKKQFNLLTKAFFSTSINQQSVILEESSQLKNMNQSIFQQQFNQLKVENKLLGIEVQTKTILQRSSSELSENEYLIQIKGGQDLARLAQTFMELYPQLINKPNIVLYIDVRRISIYHYLVTEKYLKIKFEKQPQGSIPYQIKLYKYLKEIIYQNIDNCIKQVKDAFQIFYGEANQKILQLLNYFGDSLKIADIVNIFKSINENDKGEIEKSQIRRRGEINHIPKEITEKIIDQWLKFMKNFMQNQQGGINLSIQIQEYSEILAYSDF